MKSIKKLLRYINSKRHAAGYGVHSQFAFELIKEVIHTPYSYYAYNDNKYLLAKAGVDKYADLKYAELLFRLINRFNAKDILEIGSNIGINTLYLSSLSKQSNVVCIELNNEKIEIAQTLLTHKTGIIFNTDIPKDRRFDAVIWDLEQYPLKNKKQLDTIAKAIKREGFIVVNYINKRRENKQVWQDVIKLNKLTMSFHLGTLGIAFFKSGLPKLNYDVYF